MTISSPSSVDARLIVIARDDARRAEAKAWAELHNYRFVDMPFDGSSSEYDGRFALCFNREVVELEWCQPRPPSPLRVDFVRGSIGHRLRAATVRQELLARAVGLQKYRDVRVLDGTAGMGRDGVLLAMLGSNVTLVERAPWMAKLLQDGLRRALCEANVAARVDGRIRLEIADARDVMRAAAGANPGYDVVYLDPMFPESGQSAMPAKAMQALQGLLEKSDGGTSDAELLELALACARRRVVVKRPRLGPTLDCREPSYALIGKACRFDVYQLSGDTPPS